MIQIDGELVLGVIICVIGYFARKYHKRIHMLAELILQGYKALEDGVLTKEEEDELIRLLHKLVKG